MIFKVVVFYLENLDRNPHVKDMIERIVEEEQKKEFPSASSKPSSTKENEVFMVGFLGATPIRNGRKNVLPEWITDGNDINHHPSRASRSGLSQ